VDVGLASTESEAGRTDVKASQVLEILTVPGCIHDCIARKRSEDKLRVIGVNEASMGALSLSSPSLSLFSLSLCLLMPLAGFAKLYNAYTMHDVAGSWVNINPIPPFTGLNVNLGVNRGQ